MLRVIGCLTMEHDLQLVLLAAAICAIGTFASLMVSRRAVRGEQRDLWLVLLAVCAAATVWATHFLAMLAYRVSVPMTYDPGLTAASFLLGALVIGAGFAACVRNQGSAAWALAGGAIVGAGVAGLHYVGMAALRFPGTLQFHADLVVASIVLSSAFGAAALWVLDQKRGPAVLPAGGVLLILMTVSLHFTGMGALALDLDWILAENAEGISRSTLAVAVALAALIVLLIGAGGAMVDKRVSRRLRGEAERFRTLADGAFEGLIVHRDGVVVDANAAARRMFGWTGTGAGQVIGDWFGAPGRQEAVELELPGPDGRSFPTEVSRREMRLPDGGRGELLAVRDLTARKESEARIAHLALHDPLTDLPNRRLFLELADKAIVQARRGGQCLAVLAIDLDGFKQVNDMHGHAAGDALLKAVAERIGGLLRGGDVFARFGGDEFVILQNAASQPRAAMALAERLIEGLSAPVRVGESDVAVTASVGVALHPTDGATIEELLRHADTAMYRAKADGKATCRFFEEQMDAALEARQRLEARLRRAVVEGQLEVAFQPLVGSGALVPLGFEALVRWRDPELGFVSPADFIPVAEETGLIVPIGEFVMRRACFVAARWSQPLRVAVNLSAVQFRRKGLVEMVRAALRDSGLPGERLELEITESLLIDNRDEVLRALTELKALGVHIAMDDFGTGYSSLSYLQSFPFDKLKIDRAFVSDLSAGSQNAVIVRAVASMGKSLRMRVVAEGVETAEQAGLLADLECDELQGYLISRPMPASAVEGFLAKQATPRLKLAAA